MHSGQANLNDNVTQPSKAAVYEDESEEDEEVLEDRGSSPLTQQKYSGTKGQ